MKVLAIELSDSGIMAASGTKEDAKFIQLDSASISSPAGALLSNGELLTGCRARKSGRLYPRHFTDHYWEKLSTDAVTLAALQNHSQAELAFAHIQQLWKTLKEESQNIIFMTPGSFDKTQLGLLLGIAKELSIPVQALSDISLLSLMELQLSGKYLHIDIHQHQTTITTVVISEKLVRENVLTRHSCGWAEIYSVLIKKIASEYVRETRFDPLHSAQCEQLLIDQIYTWLEDPEIPRNKTFEIESNNRRFRLDMDQNTLAEALKDSTLNIINALEETLATQPGSSIILSNRAVRVPGLLDMLQEKYDKQVSTLSPGAAALNAVKFSDCFNLAPADQKGISFFTQIPHPFLSEEIT